MRPLCCARRSSRSIASERRPASASAPASAIRPSVTNSAEGEVSRSSSQRSSTSEVGPAHAGSPISIGCCSVEPVGRRTRRGRRRGRVGTDAIPAQSAFLGSRTAAAFGYASMSGRSIRSASRSRPRAKASVARSSVSVARLALPPAMRRNSSVASVRRRRRRGAPPSPLVRAVVAPDRTGVLLVDVRAGATRRPDAGGDSQPRVPPWPACPTGAARADPLLSRVPQALAFMNGPVTSPSLPGRRSLPLPPRRMPSRDDIGLRSDVLRASDFRPPPPRLSAVRSELAPRARTPLRERSPSGRRGRPDEARVRSPAFGYGRSSSGPSNGSAGASRRAPRAFGAPAPRLGAPPVRPPRPWDAFLPLAPAPRLASRAPSRPPPALGARSSRLRPPLVFATSHPAVAAVGPHPRPIWGAAKASAGQANSPHEGVPEDGSPTASVTVAMSP